MTFKSLIADDIDAVFLDTDDFAETITYFPKGKQKRSLAAVVTRRGKRIEAGVAHLTTPETCETFVKRDAAAGIDAPTIGDAVRLEGEDDRVRWGFESIIEEDAAALRILWTKQVIHRTGQLRTGDL